MANIVSATIDLLQSQIPLNANSARIQFLTVLSALFRISVISAM